MLDHQRFGGDEIARFHRIDDPGVVRAGLGCIVVALIVDRDQRRPGGQVAQHVAEDPVAQALGQGSVFEDEFGYYLDPVSPSLPSFPEGWQERLIPLDFGDVKAFFVQPDDVAVSKYMRGEERDLRWLLAGLKSGLLDMHTIERRIASAPALEGELPAARKRMARHRKALKLT